MPLQGGPGGSSTGFGNFMEIGPLDVDLKPRDTNWVRQTISIDTLCLQCDDFLW